MAHLTIAERTNIDGTSPNLIGESLDELTAWFLVSNS
jgi:hypothetical protein